MAKVAIYFFFFFQQSNGCFLHGAVFLHVTASDVSVSIPHMYMLSHTEIPLRKIVGMFELYSKGSIMKRWQDCPSTGHGEGTVMCVLCSPKPHSHKKVTINVVSSDKVAWAGTQ